MNWRKTTHNGNDSYVNAECVTDPAITYIGFMPDFQPHGYGAVYNNGHLVECGEWENGRLIYPMDEKEYNKEMNSLFNKR